MPYVLPRSMTTSTRVALVLAFGKLSTLEACTLMKGGISDLEEPCDRVSLVTATPEALQRVPRLTGIHKMAPLIETLDEGHPEPSELVALVADHFDDLPSLAVSAYDVDEEDYDQVVRSLLDGLREEGFKKTRLLRPENNELRAEQVLSRGALDVVAFPNGRGCGLGLTAWVPDAHPMKERGVRKPAPNSEISLSPRLASLFVNLAGLPRGGTFLDPFCGSGTILAEGLLRSHKCIGVDSSGKRVKETIRNLRWLASSTRRAPFEVFEGDARDLPEVLGGRRVDAVVTEPLLLPSLDARPRTETAEAMIDSAGAVYADALASMARVLVPGGRIVVVVPVVLTMEGREVSISLDGGPLGLKQHQPGPLSFEYPVRLSFESTRWVRRAVYVFESRP